MFKNHNATCCKFELLHFVHLMPIMLFKVDLHNPILVHIDIKLNWQINLIKGKCSRTLNVSAICLEFLLFAHFINSEC